MTDPSALAPGGTGRTCEVNLRLVKLKKRFVDVLWRRDVLWRKLPNASVTTLATGRAGS